MTLELVLAGVGILVALNGAILGYVVSIERRLTRLETTIEHEPWKPRRL